MRVLDSHLPKGVLEWKIWKVRHASILQVVPCPSHANLDCPAMMLPRAQLKTNDRAWANATLLTHRIHVWHILGNIYHQYTPNVGIYTIHGSYGLMIFNSCGMQRVMWWENQFMCISAPASRQHQGNRFDLAGHDYFFSWFRELTLATGNIFKWFGQCVVETDPTLCWTTHTVNWAYSSFTASRDGTRHLSVFILWKTFVPIFFRALTKGSFTFSPQQGIFDIASSMLTNVSQRMYHSGTNMMWTKWFISLHWHRIMIIIIIILIIISISLIIIIIIINNNNDNNSHQVHAIKPSSTSILRFIFKSFKSLFEPSFKYFQVTLQVS